MSKFINFFKGKIWWKTFQLTFFIVFFTMLPYFVEFTNYLFFNKSFNHYSDGQFFTYSISLLTSSILAYLSLSSFKDTFSIGVNLWSILLLFVLAVFYSMVVVSPIEANLNTVYWVSLILFIITLIQFYHSQYLLNSKSPDIGEQRREETDNIADALN